MVDAIMRIAAVAMVAALAWDFGRRWIEYRRALFVETDRLDTLNSRMRGLEGDLATHKTVHQKAIDNLVKEMREEVGEVKTRTSLALERAGNAQQRRFGR